MKPPRHQQPPPLVVLNREALIVALAHAVQETTLQQIADECQISPYSLQRFARREPVMLDIEQVASLAKWLDRDINYFLFTGPEEERRRARGIDRNPRSKAW